MQHSNNGTHNGAFTEKRDIKEQLRGYAQEASRGVRDAADYIRQHDMAAIKRDFAEQIRAKPLATVAVGFAVGFLLGKLLK